MPESAKQLFQRVLQGKIKNHYPPELRSFALTLNFYSAKAYSYVRKTFYNALPHPRTIQKWYESVDCSPGFSKEALVALQNKVKEAKQIGRHVVCSLMLDEMAIRKKIEWTGHKFSGYVDFGADIANDSTPEAKEALVIMVNCVNGRWKIPIAYFFIDGLGGREKANIVKRCLEFIHESGIEIISLTFDGAASNISMANFLGANVSVENMKTWFPHPISNRSIYILPDPPHMLKLIRNTIASRPAIYDDNGNAIEWSYLRKLVDIQNKEGLHIATKIRNRHIDWTREKMKVKVAAQTLSLSVAKALKYLRETNHPLNFKNSEPTETFLTNINDAFDILNSRNLLAKHYKCGLQYWNKEKIFLRIDEIVEYLKNLKESQGGLPMYSTGRKMGFIGMIISLNSLKSIFEEHVSSSEPILKYVLANKLSQDHLEIFFSAVRSRGGHNNNPTARQFESAYKRLLIHCEVTGSQNANCLDQLPISILTVSSSRKAQIIPSGIESLDANLQDENIIFENQSHLNDHAYYKFPEFGSLSGYVVDIVSYISGFVVRQVKKVVKCNLCICALTSTDHRSRLVTLKQYSSNPHSGLINASPDVIYLCKLAESEFRIIEGTTNLNKENIIEILVIKCLRNMNKSVFKCLHDHMFDEDAQGNHVIFLIKIIIAKYLKLRFHHKANSINDLRNNKRVRSVLTKQILFSNQ